MMNVGMSFAIPPACVPTLTSSSRICEKTYFGGAEPSSRQSRHEVLTPQFHALYRPPSSTCLPPPSADTFVPEVALAKNSCSHERVLAHPRVLVDGTEQLALLLDG